MVNDVYDIISSMSATAEGCIALCAKHTVSALCQAVSNHCWCMSAISLLVSIDTRIIYCAC